MLLLSPTSLSSTSLSPTSFPPPDDISPDEISPDKILARSLARSLKGRWRQGEPPRLAVACSGGGDSLALLLLCQKWRKQQSEHESEHENKKDGRHEKKTSLVALICDHRQRASSTKECITLKKRLADEFALPSVVFAPSTPLASYKGNLQQNMRLFRLQTMLGWCAENGISFLALGHTRDDQIETHALQQAGLLRGRGGMRELRRAQTPSKQPSREQTSTRREQGGGARKGDARNEGDENNEDVQESAELFLLRPLLDASRTSLRAWLQERGVTKWLEDPSNASSRYARNRIRPACANLSRAAQDRLLVRAAMLREEEEAVEKAARRFKHAYATTYEEGYMTIESRAFLALDEGVAFRVLAEVARSVGGKGVRRGQVQRVGNAWRAWLGRFLHEAEDLSVYEKKHETGVFSLGRCLLFVQKKEKGLKKGIVFYATRTTLGIEPILLKTALERERGVLWDGRFRLEAPVVPASLGNVANWICAPLGRRGVVAMRSRRARERTGDERFERSWLRFEELPWRIREVLPSFWREEKLYALPTLGLLRQSEPCLARAEERLPSVRFVCAEERNLSLSAGQNR